MKTLGCDIRLFDTQIWWGEDEFDKTFTNVSMDRKFKKIFMITAHFRCVECDQPYSSTKILIQHIKKDHRDSFT